MIGLKKIIRDSVGTSNETPLGWAGVLALAIVIFAYVVRPVSIGFFAGSNVTSSVTLKN